MNSHDPQTSNNESNSSSSIRTRSRPPTLSKLVVRSLLVFGLCLNLILFTRFRSYLLSSFNNDVYNDDGILSSIIGSSSSSGSSDSVSTLNEEDSTTSTLSSSPTSSSPSAPLNILLLYPDDWRYDSLGSEKPYVLTPFLDSLAQQGIRFTHNAVTTSVCWMSRATLFMGQYTSRHKSYKLKCPRFGTTENWKHSWVSILQQHGYHTGLVGKWQYYVGNFSEYFQWHAQFEGRHWEENFRQGTKDLIHATDLTKMYVFDFFNDRPKDKPFALSVAFYPPKPVGNGRAPGHQFQPTNETKKLYENVTIPEPLNDRKTHKLLPEFLHRGPAVGRFGQRYHSSEHYQASMRNYFALVTGVDQACKEIVDRLKEEGLYDNTMIIFTTDNGMFHGSHGLAGKWYPYQESIRVPLIIYDPRMPDDKIGTLDDSFTLNVDLATTILGAAGLKPDDLMQGRDISDLYLPNEKNDNHLSQSVDVEPWRNEFFYEFPSFEEIFIPSSTALVRKTWKYIYWPEHNREQLFDLQNDPLEVNDLYDKNETKSIIDEMRKRHDEYRAELHDPTFINDTAACHEFSLQLFGEQ